MNNLHLQAIGLKYLGMKREKQELLERNEGNESQKEESVVDQQADRLEDAFDRKFWIKVSNLYDLNSEFGLFDIVLG